MTTVLRWNHYDDLLTLLRGHNSTHAIIEGVQLWTGNSISMASTQRGDTFELAYMVGRYTQIIESFGAQVKIVTPNQWKGQLPKEVMQKRVYELLPALTEVNEHALDAVGIGLAACGILDKRIYLL